MSVCALVIMGVLFLSETIAFARTDIATSVSLDDNVDPQIRLNFNITFFALQCDFVSVDVWDSIGTNKQNVTKNVEKWQLDSDGTRRIFSGRNREVREVKHDTHDISHKEMTEEGAAVTTLTKANYQQFLDAHEMTFINFFAPWCIWCQRMHPTWEMFARKAREEGMPIGIANVDCQENMRLCQEARVMAFPTVRWFTKGEAVMPDYKQDRTVAALLGFGRRKLELNDKYKDWEEKNRHLDDDEKRTRAPPGSNANGGRPDHPGCQVSGHLMVNRVPGNFLVEAKSKNHNLNAAMTNVSHRVNHLSFGEKISQANYKTKRILKQVPDMHKQFNPIDMVQYKTDQFHQAWHHYVKVVSTHLELDNGSGQNSLMTYQFLHQSQIVYYKESDVPQARFSYDISPMSVVIRKDTRKWYDYLTSLCAIIGGSFTTLGLIDAFLFKVFKPKIA